MVLDASSNGMGRKEIEAVLDLYRLEVLNLGGNDIDEMAQVCLVTFPRSRGGRSRAAT